MTKVCTGCFLKINYSQSFGIGILHKSGMDSLAVEIGNIGFLKVFFFFVHLACQCALVCDCQASKINVTSY